jgi:hypothetical protein
MKFRGNGYGLITIIAVILLLLVPLVQPPRASRASGDPGVNAEGIASGINAEGIASGINAAGTRPGQQDLTFRLINLERQVESLQARVDFLERMARNPLPGDSIGASANAQTMIEIQRQMLSLAEQQLLMQSQLLELKKMIDQQGDQQNKQAEPPATRPAPKKPSRE